MTNPARPSGEKPAPETVTGEPGSDIRVKRGIDGTENAPEMQRRGMKDQQAEGKNETGATESGNEDKGVKRWCSALTLRAIWAPLTQRTTNMRKYIWIAALIAGGLILKKRDGEMGSWPDAVDSLKNDFVDAIAKRNGAGQPSL